MKPILVLSGLLLGAALAAPCLPAVPAVIDLITRNEVQVAASPARVWPYILDFSAWKQGPKVTLVSGKPEAVGAQFAAVMPNDPHTVVFNATNVEVVPLVRRMIRLNTPDGTLLGFATWELTASARGTLVVYHVESVLPAGSAEPATPERLAVAQREAYESNHKRFDVELAMLKRLVEGR